MQIKQVLKKFNLHPKVTATSLYPYAPVYKVTLGDEALVVKQTCADWADALTLAKYTRQLKNAGIPIVSPVPMQANPLRLKQGNWVIYPFVQGHHYSGCDEEIVAAGRLLGQIHALSSTDNQEGLPEYEAFNLTQADIDGDFAAIEQHLAAQSLNVDVAGLKNKVTHIIAQQHRLQTLSLPKVATPYDYKADNLVYVPVHGPYIIDPDHALFVPRTFDLALAFLLFHNVLASAPSALFTPQQWRLFMQGYAEEIVLTERERAAWPQAVQHLFLGEVVWLMADFAEGWRQTRQVALFESIINLMLDPEALADYGL